MIDLDDMESLLQHCKELDEVGGLANRVTPSVVIELITLLRQAEKDAARYRWLRDEAADADQTSPLVFMADECADIVTDGDYQGIMFGKLLDAAIDEAMQCK
jgi:hypothetical protein